MNKTPIKYVLYTHYAAYENKDFETYKIKKKVNGLSGVQRLVEHFRGLKELLTTPGHEGLLVMFYAPGFADFLQGIADGKNISELLSENVNLQFARDVAEHVQQLLTHEDLDRRVRFITCIDLKVILGKANEILADKFPLYFIGPGLVIRYDSPKIVEAILRLRIIGNGVPILRLDHDVIFRFEGITHDIRDLGLFKAVECASSAYHLRLDDPTVSSFIFSLSYDTRELMNTSSDIDRFQAWSRAFATRVYPALTVDLCAMKKLIELPDDKQDNEWDKYVKNNLNEPLARRFFGLKNNNLTPDGTKGLTAIGAHPLYAVISGALLCLSEGAILDLPPFSNFQNNVMWIDDHLKYSLHRAMQHFTSGDTLRYERSLSHARLDDVTVTKERPSISNLPAYVLGDYLPTLLLGTIMDSWITTNPILKCRLSDLKSPDNNLWCEAKKSDREALLPDALLGALQVGTFKYKAKRKLRVDLMSSALQRINEVRNIWMQLKTDELKTFASYWAEGTVEDNFPAGCFKKSKNKLWRGIAPKVSQDSEILTISDLSSEIAVKVSELCDDVLTYIEWTLDWPKFVQIVRSVPQGTFKGDLTWSPPKNKE
ncbi:MAG: hypothetical protein H7843_10515 [Nitrospirota bacterium]